ncbi:hypothetical protein JEM67_21600 [Serratia sp. PAMC26656]|uniref:hypothetical protein n=1 Tax=Serratia sp. PAMC26656 TaxID=2775909 RepID=UPI0018F6824D|nr:hypothetical protein [Serratia sp. PAMC26656]MBJ7892096.1 hypothetical protein [Serratia sp. PAMC26656]
MLTNQRFTVTNKLAGNLTSGKGNMGLLRETAKNITAGFSILFLKQMIKRDCEAMPGEAWRHR